MASIRTDARMYASPTAPSRPATTPSYSIRPNIWGPPLPCENITVTNCRLSSASSAVKFCDGNMNCIRHVTVDNTVITDSNRGIAFMVFDGGYVSDVVLSNLTIECRRHDWFWWGDGDPIHFNIKRRSEVDGTARAQRAAGRVDSECPDPERGGARAGNVDDPRASR